MAEVALDGFDAVAYHREGRARQGSPAHSHDWNGKAWHFSSEEHRAAFAADPDRFAPEYGGDCAFAMSLGKRVPGMARHWQVRNGRLFLQANAVAAFLFKVLPGRVKAADERWAAER